MCGKPILGIVEYKKFVPDCSKNQEMCNNAVDNYPHPLKVVSDCYMTQKMCDKTVSTHSAK